MARTERPVSHRRRFLIGLALAALLGVGLGASLLAGSLAGERRARVERKAVVTLSALAALVDRAGGGGVEEAAPAEASGSSGSAGSAGSDTGFGLGDELSALDEAPAEGAAEWKARRSGRPWPASRPIIRR